MKWEMLTKRTNDPKLGWLQSQLNRHGIPNRRRGWSFHAPILEVREQDFDAAWRILAPVDEIPDNDPRFRFK